MSQLSALRRSIKSSSSSRYACALERVGTTSSAGSLQPKITADPSARARTSACAGGDPDSVLVAEASSLMASSSTFLPSTWVQIKHSGENRPPCTAVTGSDEARTARVWGETGAIRCKRRGPWKCWRSCGARDSRAFRVRSARSAPAPVSSPESESTPDTGAGEKVAR